MLDRLEALQALASAGTMGRAATTLRVSQSAVSKRIAALERELSIEVIERAGRRVRLTAEGQRLLAEARPLLSSLREVMQRRTQASEQVVRVAATDSLLASFLPGALRAAVDRLPGVRIELHAHRGPLLLERVRSGDYSLGLCPIGAGDAELAHRELLREPMVIVPSRLQRPPNCEVVHVWTIEKRSLTWEAIESQLTRLYKRSGLKFEVDARLESFTALVQVARAGFAHALVPREVARNLGVPSEALIPVPGVSRRIAAVARRATLRTAAVRSLLSTLEAALAET